MSGSSTENDVTYYLVSGITFSDRRNRERYALPKVRSLPDFLRFNISSEPPKFSTSTLINSKKQKTKEDGV